MKTKLLLSGLVLISCGTGLAQQQTTAVQHLPLQSATSAMAKPVVAEEHAPTAKPDGASHEGIKVHGHWIIDVKNPDGSFVSHTEFENALVTPAAADETLAKLLTSQQVMGGFGMSVDSSTAGALCPGSAPSDYYAGVNSCYLYATPLVNLWLCLTPRVCISQMTTSAVTTQPTGSMPPAYAVQLQGSFTVPVGGPITGVHTFIASCNTPWNTTPVTTEACSAVGVSQGFYINKFTAATLPTPISVVAGQYVMVTVKISFS